MPHPVNLVDVSQRPDPSASPARQAADERFEVLARLARQHFAVSTALITLNDAQQPYLQACAGLACKPAPGERWLYKLPLGAGSLVQATQRDTDNHFSQQPLVIDHPHLRFYACCPLQAANGDLLGALWLLDDQPRELDEQQRDHLRDLARLAAISAERDHLESRLRKEADALRESERRMALAIAGSGTGIWDRNIQTGEIHYSEGWKALLGYAADEVSNRIEDSYKRVHPDDLAAVQAAIQAHHENKLPSYSVEHRLRCKDGSYKWVSSRGKVISRDSAGRPLRMVGTTSDISVMHSMAERLQQTVDLITNLTNQVPGLVFQYCRPSVGPARFDYASTGISDMYELTPAAASSSDEAITCLIHPDDLPAYRASLEVSRRDLSPWHLEYRVLLPKQGLRWRQGAAQPQRMADGGTLWHGFITDVTERKRLDAELQEFATTDFLTQLPNRRHFMGHIEAELTRIRRGNSQPAAVLMCDLDHFKLINDQWGHAVGDLALKHFAHILREQLRKSDLAGRVGGEEFAVVLSDTTLSAAQGFAQRVQQRLAHAPLLQNGQQIALTVSMGIAAMSASDLSVDTALSRSDLALYSAKAHGRNRIEYL